MNAADFDALALAATSYRTTSKAPVILNAKENKNLDFEKYAKNNDYISMIPLKEGSAAGRGRATTRTVPLDWVKENPKLVKHIDREIILEPFISTIRQLFGMKGKDKKKKIKKEIACDQEVEALIQYQGRFQENDEDDGKAKTQKQAVGFA